MKTSFFAIFTGIIIFFTSCSNPSSNDASNDTTEVASNNESAGVIRVMAYNIHHANPPSKPDVIDIDSIIGVIRAQDPDIIALQEVDVNTERSGTDLHQAKEIASQLNMNYFFGKGIDYQGGEYGVAIVSKYPISEEVVHRLPVKEGTNGEPRTLTTAKVTLPDNTEIRFGSTHLDAQRDPANKMLQINKIVEIASEEQLPFIIAGDFNATPGSEVIDVLDSHFTRTCSDCAPTIPVTNPRKAIDFIAYKHPQNKFKVVSHKVVDEQYASDHLPIVAEISYK